MFCDVRGAVKKDVSAAIKKMLDAPLKRRECRCKKGIYRHHIVTSGEAILAAEELARGETVSHDAINWDE